MNMENRKESNHIKLKKKITDQECQEEILHSQSQIKTQKNNSIIQNDFGRRQQEKQKIDLNLNQQIQNLGVENVSQRIYVDVNESRIITEKENIIQNTNQKSVQIQTHISSKQSVWHKCKYYFKDIIISVFIFILFFIVFKILIPNSNPNNSSQSNKPYISDESYDKVKEFYSQTKIIKKNNPSIDEQTKQQSISGQQREVDNNIIDVNRIKNYTQEMLIKNGSFLENQKLLEQDIKKQNKNQLRTYQEERQQKINEQQLLRSSIRKKFPSAQQLPNALENQKQNSTAIGKQNQKKNIINSQQQEQKNFYKNKIKKYQLGSPAQRLKQTLKFWMLTGKNITESQELQEYAQAEKDYFQKKYQISKYGEIQICVLVLSYMNEANDRYKRNLDSIFQQQYKNYKVYYVDDNSGDKTAELVEKYIKDRKLESKMKLYKNKQKKGKSSNQFYIGQKNCKPGSVMVVVDGDDQLIGRQVFKFLSAAYQSTNLYYIYTQFVIINDRDKTIRQGFSVPLQSIIITSTSYRSSALPSHLRTWMSDLFLDIRKEDLMIDGEFPQIGEDVGSSFQLMEKAGTKVGFINQYIYRYVMGTGYNDYQISRQKQTQVDNYYRRLPKFPVYSKNITYNINIDQSNQSNESNKDEDIKGN